MAALFPTEKPAVGRWADAVRKGSSCRCRDSSVFQQVATSHFKPPFSSMPSSPTGSYPAEFPTQILCAFLISTMQAARPTHIIIDMIPLIILLHITSHEPLPQAIFFVPALFLPSLVQIFPSRLCTQTFSKHSIY